MTFVQPVPRERNPSVSEPIVFLNGEFVPQSAARVSIFDRAFCAGDGIYDVARTFGHKPNKLREHCERMLRSAKYTRIDLPYSAADLEDLVLKVLERNMAGVDPADDRIIWMIATRGIDPPSRNPLDAARPTLMIYTVPVNYHRFVRYYESGLHLITASTRRTPPECLDARAKIINKMNHIQAELEAKAADRDAMPLMLAMDGTVAESSAANVFFVSQGRLCTPRSNILLGIMRDNVIEVAREERIEVVEGDFHVYDFAIADEVFLTTTSYSILPVGRLNGRPYGKAPGPVTTRLIKAWGRKIGVDIIEQARRHASVPATA